MFLSSVFLAMKWILLLSDVSVLWRALGYEDRVPVLS